MIRNCPEGKYRGPVYTNQPGVIILFNEKDNN